jgi:hypothetical protein
LLSVAAASIVYAFFCQVRLARKASDLGKWVRRERPDLWSQLNFVARSWNGGHPGLKLIYKRKVVAHPQFDRQYERLRALERRLLWGIGIGAACIGMVALGTRLLGWHW